MRAETVRGVPDRLARGIHAAPALSPLAAISARGFPSLRRPAWEIGMLALIPTERNPQQRIIAVLTRPLPDIAGHRATVERVDRAGPFVAPPPPLR